jgi:hypothetical protein
MVGRTVKHYRIPVTVCVNVRNIITLDVNTWYSFQSRFPAGERPGRCSSSLLYFFFSSLPFFPFFLSFASTSRFSFDIHSLPPAPLSPLEGTACCGQPGGSESDLVSSLVPFRSTCLRRPLQGIGLFALSQNAVSFLFTLARPGPVLSLCFFQSRIC